MLDSEPISVSKAPDDFGSMVFELIASINFKMAFLLLVVYLLLTSDVFINRVLSKFPGAVEYKNSTSYGTVITGVLLVLFYMCTDVLIRAGVL